MFTLDLIFLSHPGRDSHRAGLLSFISGDIIDHFVISYRIVCLWAVGLIWKDFNVNDCSLEGLGFAGSINNTSSYLEDMYNYPYIVCGFAYVA